MKRVAIALIGIFCLGALNGVAEDALKEVAKPNPYSGVLSSVSAAEMPAKAAELVKKSRARDWANTTAGVIKGAVQINPAATPAVAGAVARAVPEMAAVASETAATEQPKQAALIARAAAVAAPTKAGKVAVAVSRAVPGSYRVVALTIADAVPGSGRTVLEALATAFPELKPAIDKGLAEYAGNMPPMALILDQAPQAAGSAVAGTTAAGADAMAQGPSINPPKITGPPPVINPVGPGNIHPGPPQGRHYAQP